MPDFGTTNVTMQFAPVGVGGFTNTVMFATANGGAATNTVTGTGGIAPVALFSGSPTNGTSAFVVGAAWETGFTLGSGTNTITVIATDASANMNTATQVVHAVLSPATTPTNAPPQITAGLWVTNALLEAGSTTVVLVDETNVFSVAATAPPGDSLEYQWVFGDGISSNTTIGTVDRVYTNECGPYNASMTVSDGSGSTNSDLIVSAACEMQITRLQVNLNFAKTNSDSCTIQGMVELPAGYNFAGKSSRPWMSAARRCPLRSQAKALRLMA